MLIYTLGSVSSQLEKELLLYGRGEEPEGLWNLNSIASRQVLYDFHYILFEIRYDFSTASMSLSNQKLSSFKKILVECTVTGDVSLNIGYGSQTKNYSLTRGDYILVLENENWSQIGSLFINATRIFGSSTVARIISVKAVR